MQTKQDPVPLLMASQSAPMSVTFRDSGLITCSFSPSPADLGELSPLVSMGERTLRGPDFLFHVPLPSALHLDLGGSVQCSNMGLHLYLHLSSDEGSL